MPAPMVVRMKKTRKMMRTALDCGLAVWPRTARDLAMEDLADSNGCAMRCRREPDDRREQANGPRPASQFAAQHCSADAPRRTARLGIDRRSAARTVLVSRLGRTPTGADALFHLRDRRSPGRGRLRAQDVGPAGPAGARPRPGAARA